MRSDPIFTGWRNHHAEIWGNAPMRLGHRLHRHELFSLPSLARLIESYPRQHYRLVQWGEHGRSGSFREGDMGGLSGQAVLDAIARGRIWINLRNAPLVDPAYGAVRDEIFAELRQRLPGFDPFTTKLGILVSSPRSRTLYHCDLPGQSLWQIHGRKRVYVYPASRPFVTQEHVERVALSGVEVNMPYEPWYDEHARVFEIEPGDMLHWQLNAPHRVDNHDCLNVSMTLEWFTEDIRRAHMVTVANGILRWKLGLAPKSRSTVGASFWSKAILQKALRDTPFVRRENKARRRPDFRLDPHRPGAIVDLDEAA
jgi:hypothetical protein